MYTILGLATMFGLAGVMTARQTFVSGFMILTAVTLVATAIVAAP